MLNTAGSLGNSSSFGAYCSATGGGAGEVSVVGSPPGIGSGGDYNIPGDRGAYDQAVYLVAAVNPVLGWAQAELLQVPQVAAMAVVAMAAMVVRQPSVLMVLLSSRNFN